MTGQGEETIPDEPAWVKCSTGLKQELATLDGYTLKVFLYIGLSVNFATGKAHPGVRNIAENTGMNKDTVTKAIGNLVKLGFLTVERREGTGNIYKPIRYLSIGTVRPNQTPEKQLSGDEPKLSDDNLKLSGALEGILHNKNNKIKQDERDGSQTDFQKVWKDLEVLCGAVALDTARLIDVWIEKHPVERIRQAVGVAKDKGARSPKYVDQVLISWEVNGYPKTREELVAERRQYAPPSRAARQADVFRAGLEKMMREVQSGN